MKTLFILLLYNFSIIYAQWFPLNSGTSGNLNALCVVDSLIVYAVGDFGVILKTLDGGVTWGQKNPVLTSLRSVSFCDQNTGMTVGDSGVILKTSDGGDTWYPLNSGIIKQLKSVWFQSQNNATILQDHDNKYMITSNGGGTWNFVENYPYPPYDFSYKDMAYTNWGTSRGAITSSGVFNQYPYHYFFRVLFTSQNGNNWNEFFEYDMNFFHQVSVLPEGRIFAVGGNIFTKISGPWEVRGYLGGYDVNDLFFVNNFKGSAILDNDGIYRTSDGGWTWLKAFPGSYNSVVFADTNIGYAVGSGGEIIKTLNGGVSVVTDIKENIIYPDSFSIEQNYPNPFNPGTTIQFSIPEDVQNVKLIVYSALGEKVAELVNTGLQAGHYKYAWNANQFASGIYIYQLVTEKFVSTKKMMLLK